MKYTVASKKEYHETIVAVYELMSKAETNLTKKDLLKLEAMAKASEEYEDNVMGLRLDERPYT